MSLSDIQEKIRADAHKEAEEINEHALQEIGTIEEETQREKEKITQTYEARAAKQCNDIERTLLSEAQQYAKHAHEKVKEEALSSVFNTALQTLIDLESDRYTTLIARYLDAIPSEEIHTISAPPHRLRETQTVCEHLSQIKVEPADHVRGGFIARGESVQYDYSFETLLTHAQEKLTIEIAQKLFPSHS